MISKGGCQRKLSKKNKIKQRYNKVKILVNYIENKNRKMQTAKYQN